MGDDSDGPNVIEEGGYVPSLKPGPSIPHYYGDYVRQIFMVCGAAMLIFSPFLARGDFAVLPFEIGGAIVVAILGALTNPVKQLSLLANSIAAGVGVVVYELLALSEFYNEAYMAFIARETLAVAFLFALYFSLKTLRNMVFNRIGKKTTVGDFVDDSQQ